MKLFITLASLLASSALAVPYQAVQGDSQNWATGFIYAKKKSVANRGLIFRTYESDLLIPSPDYKDGEETNENLFGSEKLHVSSKDKRVYKKMGEKKKDDVIVLSYKYKHHRISPLRLFTAAESSYMVFDVSEATTFEETPSFKNYGAVHTVENDYRGFYDEQTIRGRIHHVSRWGKVGGKACTAYIYRPVVMEYKKRVGQTESSSSTLGVGVGGSVSASTIAAGVAIGPAGALTAATVNGDKVSAGVGVAGTTEVADQFTFIKRNGLELYGMNVYTESGCQYAEDLLKSNSLVEIDYSVSWFEFWNWYSKTILRMKLVK